MFFFSHFSPSCPQQPSLITGNLSSYFKQWHRSIEYALSNSIITNTLKHPTHICLRIFKELQKGW